MTKFYIERPEESITEIIFNSGSSDGEINISDYGSTHISLDTEGGRDNFLIHKDHIDLFIKALMKAKEAWSE